MFRCSTICLASSTDVTFLGFIVGIYIGEDWVGDEENLSWRTKSGSCHWWCGARCSRLLPQAGAGVGGLDRLGHANGIDDEVVGLR